MALVRSAGFEEVRATRYGPPLSRPYCLTIPTTPAIVMGFFGSNQTCLPVGLSRGQKPLSVNGIVIIPALEQGNLHGPKVIRASRPQIHLQFLTRRRSVAFHVDASPTCRAG